MTIDSREKACNVLGISTSASTNEINQAYKKLAMKWHPDKWAGKPEAERKAAEEKFKEIGEAKDYLDKNHGEDSYSHKLDEYKSESKQKITKWISEQKVSDEELGEWKDYEKSIDKIESLKELISYLARFNQWTEKYLKEKNNSASSTSDNYPYSEGGADSGYSSDSSNYSSSKSEPYYQPFTCDYCGYTVPSSDSRPKITVKGKQFCKHSCADSYIQREYDKAEHERIMNQISEDSRKSSEEHQERMRKLDQDAAERRRKSDEDWEKWKKENDQYWKDRDERWLEGVKSDCIKHVKDHYRIWKISDQQADELLGADWKQQINSVSKWEEAYRKVDQYRGIIEDKKWIIELPQDKEKAIDHIESFLDLKEIEDQQLNEELKVKDWKEEINSCANQREVERKKKALERKIKKISSDPNKKKAGLADLNYSQENYAKNQLKLSANQSLKDYVRNAKTPEERRQREDEIKTLLNKYEQESTKTRVLTSIIGVLIIGSIIGLIIYLVKKNKNK